MTQPPRIYLHAGAPRTATTVLQANVFPRLRHFHYFGKRADNAVLRRDFQPVLLMKRYAAAIRAGDESHWPQLRGLLPSVLNALKVRNHRRGGASDPERLNIARAWWHTLQRGAAILDDKPALYSDESLVESVSGLTGTLERGDITAIEQLRAVGVLDHVGLSVVVREPAGFLKASYYKAMEFRQARKAPPLSFDGYIEAQLRIHERYERASRIFLCDYEACVRYFGSICRRSVVVRYEDLIRSPHPVDMLLGMQTGEDAVPFSVLPRENSSWRDPVVNGYILSAEGVPPGIAIEAYASTFPETLSRHGLVRSGAPSQAVH